MKRILLSWLVLCCASAVAAGQTTVGVATRAKASARKGVTATRRVVKTEQAPPAIGPYSQAIVVGEFVYMSGQIALDPKTGEMVEGGIAEQAEQVLKNLAAVLEAAGGDLGQVVKTTVFLADMNDFAAMNEIYRKYFKTNPPARSTIGVARLPRDARIEIEAVALKK